jgi:MYXO-CTERM domain-containing protein
VRRALLLGLALLACGFAPGAHAAIITGVSATSSVTTSTTGSPEAWDWYALDSFSEDCAGSCSTFTSQYALGAGIEADGGFGPFPGEDVTLQVNWTYTIDITVSEQTPGEQWQLAVDSSLLGYLTHLDTAGGSAATGLQDLSGVLGTAGLSADASMDLAGPDTASSSTFDVNQLVSRAGTFNVTGGFGSQTVSMTFSLDGSLQSSCGGAACSQAGDEAALRLGIATPAFPDILFYSAGDYAGPDGDPTAAHGHFVSVALLPVPAPEPESLALAASALGALALARRRRRRCPG